MSKVSRADWAAQVPAEGIVGVIPEGKLPASSGGVTDIGQLTGKGFSGGQIPVWSASQKKFVPGSIPSPAPSTGAQLTTLSLLLSWAGATLRPLESVVTPLAIPIATANSRVFIDPPAGEDYVFYQGQVLNAPVVQFKATNMSPSIIALVDQVYQVWVLT